MMLEILESCYQSFYERAVLFSLLFTQNKKKCFMGVFLNFPRIIKFIKFQLQPTWDLKIVGVFCVALKIQLFLYVLKVQIKKGMKARQYLRDKLFGHWSVGRPVGRSLDSWSVYDHVTCIQVHFVPVFYWGATSVRCWWYHIVADAESYRSSKYSFVICHYQTLHLDICAAISIWDFGSNWRNDVT